MNRPSSTITAASLAAAGVTLIWAMVDNFSAISVSATVVSGSTAFVAALFGYFQKETVLREQITAELKPKKASKKRP